LKWLYQKRVSSFDEMTNLPKKLREEWKQFFSISTLMPIRLQIASDGTKKFLSSSKMETELRVFSFLKDIGSPSASLLRSGAAWTVSSVSPGRKASGET